MVAAGRKLAAHREGNGQEAPPGITHASLVNPAILANQPISPHATYYLAHATNSNYQRGTVL